VGLINNKSWMGKLLLQGQLPNMGGTIIKGVKILSSSTLEVFSLSINVQFWKFPYKLMALIR
jgi:hypothetical protein